MKYTNETVLRVYAYTQDHKHREAAEKFNIPLGTIGFMQKKGKKILEETEYDKYTDNYITRHNQEHEEIIAQMNRSTKKENNSVNMKELEKFRKKLIKLASSNASKKQIQKKLMKLAEKR